MKTFLLMFPLLLLLVAVTAGAHDKVEDPRSCQQCGMDRGDYAHSRMLIAYADGSQSGTCSLHCTAIELNGHRDKKVATLQVADYYSKKLTDARKATWVIGGRKQGVMTSIPKWAFASKGQAVRFIEANGGRLAAFKEALALAEKE